MKKSFFAVLIISLLFVFSGGQALASTADASATLDLAQLDTLKASGFSWSFDNPTFTNAYANNDPAPGSGTSVPGTTSSYASAPGFADATATIGSTSLKAVSHAENSGKPQTWSNATSNATGTFSYSGLTDLEVFIKLPFTIKYDVKASPGVDAIAYGYSSVFIDLVTNDKDYHITLANYISYELANNKSFAKDRESYILLDFTLHPGDSGTFTVNAYSDTSASAVPVPAAFWLLGSGLVGLAGVRRRKMSK